jgi:beta-lactamase regulating signal transducer with metallopeptidase domain
MEMLLRAGLSNAVAATLMALLVMCLSRPLARRPAIVHGLWVLVLLKLVTPPFYEVPIPWPVASVNSVAISPESAVDAAEPIAQVVMRGDGPDEPHDLALMPVSDDAEWDESPESSNPAPFAASFIDYSRWIGVTWLAGSAVVLLLSIRRIRLFQRLLTEARAASWLEQEWVDESGRRLGLRRTPDLWWVPGRLSPMIWFVGIRPRLILPEELWKRLDARQRSTLLAHELAHVRRGDHYIRLLEFLTTAVFWWHPLVWWMRGPLRDVEEQCCDAWVVWAFPDAARAYAETLLDTLEFLSTSSRPEPLLASGLGKVPHLRRRLTMIMTGTSFRVLGVRGTLGLLALAVVLLPVGATWAQKAEEPQVLEAKLIATEGQSVNSAVLELPAELTKDGPLIFTDVIATLPSSEAHISHMTIQLQEQSGTRVMAAGSIDEVVKKLQAEIAELKGAGAPADAPKEKLAILERALNEVQKIQGSLKVYKPTPGRGPIMGNMRYIEERATRPKDDDKAPAIEKLRRQVSELRKAMEATANEIEAAQGKIRELGGDAGEVPVIQWRSAANKSQAHYQTYTVVRPVQEKKTQTYTIMKPVQQTKTVTYTIMKPVQQTKTQTYTIMKPVVEVGDRAIEKPVRIKVAPSDLKIEAAKPLKPAPSDLKVEAAKPQIRLKVEAGKPVNISPSDLKIETDRPQIRLKVEAGKPQAADHASPSQKGLDSTRIEALEKKLKALQEEVERLRKDAAQGEVKK